MATRWITASNDDVTSITGREIRHKRQIRVVSIVKDEQPRLRGIGERSLNALDVLIYL